LFLTWFVVWSSKWNEDEKRNGERGKMHLKNKREGKGEIEPII